MGNKSVKIVPNIIIYDEYNDKSNREINVYSVIGYLEKLQNKYINTPSFYSAKNIEYKKEKYIRLAHKLLNKDKTMPDYIKKWFEIKIESYSITHSKIKFSPIIKYIEYNNDEENIKQIKKEEVTEVTEVIGEGNDTEEICAIKYIK